MGVQACRLPAPKRLKPLKPLKHLKPLKPLKLCKSVSERPTAPFARRSQPTGTPRPHQWLLMGVQACRLPAPKTLKPLKPLKLCKSVSERPTAQAKATPKPHQCGTPNRAGKSYPKARSITSSGRSSLPFARRSQPTGTPRPHQWLLMGVQACRLPAPKRLKPLKPLKPLKLCKNVSERPTAQAKATPKPHQWLLLGGPACRSPGVTRFKPFKRFNILLAYLIPQPTGTPRPHQWLLMGVQACRFPSPQRFSGKNSGTPNPAGRTPPRPDITIILIIINQTCTAPTTFSPTPQKGGRRHPGASPFYI